MKTNRSIVRDSARFARKIIKKLKKIRPAAAAKSIAVIIFCAIIAAEYFEKKPVIPAAPAPRPQISIEEKIGQMLLVGFRGTEAPRDSHIAKAIAELNLGGVALFDYDQPSKKWGRNITGSGQTKELIAQLKSYSPAVPLLVAVDAEGGSVNRLKPSLGFVNIPSARSFEEKDGSYALESYWDLAKQLAGLGFNVNFAPVVDLDINPKNPVIGGLERSYSKNPGIVSTLAKSMVATHKSFGIATVLKHFPGHGSSTRDSHLGLVDVTATYRDQELKPYETLIADNAVDAIMTAHIINRDIDPDYPATLSPKFIQDILRGKLKFDGVVFSDDMQMKAIADNYGFEDAIVRAVNAGCDILGFSNNIDNYDETIAYRARDIILAAVRDGRIPGSRIDEAYARIMELKEKLK